MQNVALLYYTFKKIQCFEDRVIWRVYGRFSCTIMRDYAVFFSRASSWLLHTIQSFVLHIISKLYKLCSTVVLHHTVWYGPFPYHTVRVVHPHTTVQGGPSPYHSAGWSIPISHSMGWSIPIPLSMGCHMAWFDGPIS